MTAWCTKCFEFHVSGCPQKRKSTEAYDMFDIPKYEPIKIEPVFPKYEPDKFQKELDASWERRARSDIYYFRYDLDPSRR